MGADARGFHLEGVWIPRAMELMWFGNEFPSLSVTRGRGLCGVYMYIVDVRVFPKFLSSS